MKSESSPQEPTDPQEEYYKEFLKQLWITKGCRFTANRRFKNKHNASTFSIAILSILVIAAGITLLVFTDESGPSFVFLNITIVSSSVFILVISILESSRDYPLRADVMLRSAQRISELHDRLSTERAHQAVSKEFFEDIRAKYHQTLRDFRDNHSNIDFFYFMANHPRKFKLEGFKKLPRMWRYKFLWWWNVWGFCLVIMVGYPLAMLGIFLYFQTSVL